MKIVATLKRLLGHRRPEIIRVGPAAGLRFDPGPSNPRYAIGDNELPVQEALRKHLQAGDVFFDVGANVGFMSVLGARLVGGHGFVYAFEPVPANAELIRANAARNELGQVHVMQMAIGDTTGTARLALARYSGGAVLADVERPPDPAGELVVDISSVDQLVARGLHPPSLVKIDVEGAELQALRGMAHVCSSIRPTIVYELDAASEAALEVKRVQCERWLIDLGYVVTELPQSYCLPDWHVRHFVAEHPKGNARP